MKVSNSKKTILHILLSLITLNLSACSNASHHATIKQRVAQLKKREAAILQPIPEIIPYKKFNYTAANLRHPFSRPEKYKRINSNKPKSPLATYALSSLHMVGTLARGNMIWAIIATPDGKFYPIQVGDAIGKNNAEVVHITPEKVEILASAEFGNSMGKRKIFLRLQKGNLI